MNAAVYSAYGQSPFKVVYGWESFLPIDYVFSNLQYCKVYAVIELIQVYHKLHESIQSKIEATNRLMVLSANLH